MGIHGYTATGRAVCTRLATLTLLSRTRLVHRLVNTHLTHTLTPTPHPYPSPLPKGLTNAARERLLGQMWKISLAEIAVAAKKKKWVHPGIGQALTSYSATPRVEARAAAEEAARAAASLSTEVLESAPRRQPMLPRMASPHPPPHPCPQKLTRIGYSEMFTLQNHGEGQPRAFEFV